MRNTVTEVFAPVESVEKSSVQKPSPIGLLFANSITGFLSDALWTVILAEFLFNLVRYDTIQKWKVIALLNRLIKYCEK